VEAMDGTLLIESSGLCFNVEPISPTISEEKFKTGLLRLIGVSANSLEAVRSLVYDILYEDDEYTEGIMDTVKSGMSKAMSTVGTVGKGFLSGGLVGAAQSAGMHVPSILSKPGKFLSSPTVSAALGTVVLGAGAAASATKGAMGAMGTMGKMTKAATEFSPEVKSRIVPAIQHPETKQVFKGKRGLTHLHIVGKNPELKDARGRGIIDLTSILDTTIL
jgi:hypothetical protein